MLQILMKWKLPPFKNRILEMRTSLHVQLFSNITYNVYSKQHFQMDKQNSFHGQTEFMSRACKAWCGRGTWYHAEQSY